MKNETISMKGNCSPSGETIWITGASSGIGRQLAISLANAGNKVIVTARNHQALEELSREYDDIYALPADVTDTGYITQLADKLDAITSTLDRVILNAGSCEYFDVNSPDWAMMDRVMAVNYFGAVNCLSVAIPLLRLSESSHIVAMASQASRVPFPRAQAYGASKAALTYLIESLGVDLADTSIKTTVVQLGFVDTPMTAANDFPMPFRMSTQETVERLMVEIMSRPKMIRFPRRLSWVISLFRLVPNFWSQTIAPRLSRAS